MVDLSLLPDLDREPVQKLRSIEWFFKEAVRSPLHCFQRGAFGVASSNDNDLKRWILRAGDINQRQPFTNIINVRGQMQVADHYINLFVGYE